jgi:D-sedoheptulose 7-phosphate isomerase
VSIDFKVYLGETQEVLAKMAAGDLGGRVDRAVLSIAMALRARKPLLVCGNGGSAADSSHIAGELVGRFMIERPAYKVIALTADSSILTAWSNDYSYETVFSRQVEAYGEPGGALLAISTSGNSKNVIAALNQAKAMNMTTIGLTGEGGGAMAELCDHLLDVPSKVTPHIQEGHICLYHYICQRVERALVGIGVEAPSCH